MTRVTLETKVWENDWELVLKTSRLKDLVARCNFEFDRKVLYINNVANRGVVEDAAARCVDAGLIDDFVHVDNYAAEALDFFGLSRAELGKGYYYSIAELVSIYLTETEYLLHFSSDSIPAPGIRDPWLLKGVELLDRSPEVKVFNLTWNSHYWEAEREACYSDENFYYAQALSDQMYLIRVADFRARIYGEKNVASERYPKYGGELFEKRVDSWMRNHNFLRATYKHASYIHKNFTSNSFLKKVAVAFDSPTFGSGLRLPRR